MGMVFQNYAVFPHMSVRDNVAYGLKTRRMPRAERYKKAHHGASERTPCGRL